MNETVYFYYYIAPKIVEEIDKLPNRKMIYNNLYSNYIIKAIRQIEKKEYDLATTTYFEMVITLMNRYMSPN